MEMNDDKVFLAKLQLILTTLDEVDDIIDNNPDMQKNVDWEISDYLHLLENEDLSKQAQLEIDDRIKKCRIIRRKLNNISIIAKTFNDNRGELVFRGQREFLGNSIRATINKLDNDYKYRVLDETTINLLIAKKEDVEEKPVVIKKGRVCISKEELEERLNNGMRNKEIAEEIGVTPEYVSALKRKLGVKRRTYERRG